MADDGEPARDFRKGVPLSDLHEGAIVAGVVDGEAAILVRRGDDVLAVTATCTHYGGPLAEGLVVGETVRCPWHHACFSLRTGAMLNPPALSPLKSFDVAVENGVARVVGEKKIPAAAPAPVAPQSVVIIGGGAAGVAAAMTLRDEGYRGPVLMLSADKDPPVDRPNLSKDFLAGAAEPDWLPLKPDDFYRDNHIELRLGTEVAAIDPAAKKITLRDGASIPYGALLLATGAEPNRLSIPGSDRPHVLALRSEADAQAILARAKGAKRAVIVGAGFIGLEAAASLRKQGLDVAVVAPEAIPMERILGPELGRMVQAVHEEQGVVFHLGTTPTAIGESSVTLASGAEIPADLVIEGIGVRPRIALAEKAGLEVNRAVVVDSHMKTSAADIYAAGDIALWPDPLTGERIRVEHWAVAERQGIVAARNILGRSERYKAIPFFWSQHFDTVINYVGHGRGYDRTEITGDPKARDCKVVYFRGAKRIAVATVGRDLDSLKEAAAMEKEVA